MNGSLKLIKIKDGNKHVTYRRPLPATEFYHFKKVTSNVMQDALNVWADLWAEMENQVTSGIMISSNAENGFKPSCGWPKFFEKMWVLRHYLDFTKRFTQQ
jgi:hypothetical protein